LPGGGGEERSGKGEKGGERGRSGPLEKERKPVLKGIPFFVGWSLKRTGDGKGGEKGEGPGHALP